jgi:hypothetical protein
VVEKLSERGRAKKKDVVSLWQMKLTEHFSSRANKQKFLWWAEECPQQLRQRPRHCLRVTVWCVVANFRVRGPYYFADEDGRTITATSARYVTERPYTRSELSWKWAIYHMAAARLHNCSCSESIHGGRSRSISGTHFTARRASAACTFAWPLCLWLFI